MILVSWATLGINYFRYIFVGYFFVLEATFPMVYFYTYRGFEIWTNAGGNHALPGLPPRNAFIQVNIWSSKLIYYLNWIPSREHVTSVIQSVWQQLAAAAAESALLIAIPGRGGSTVRHTEATFAVFTAQPSYFGFFADALPLKQTAIIVTNSILESYS